MMAYASNATVAEIAKRIAAARRVLITTHTKPDGDAIGSTLALARALAHKKIQSQIVLMGPIERSLLTIVGETPIQRLEEGKKSDLRAETFDLIVVLDTGSWSQLELIEPILKTRFNDIIVIDHHAHGDEVGGVGGMRLVDPTCVSTTALLVPVIEALGVPLIGGGENDGIAEPLFVGLATDSGWFRYGNAGADAFALAARLLDCGVDKSRLYQILEETHSPQRLALEARGLASLEYVRGGSVAIQTLRMRDFQETGGSSEDLTGLVNAPMTVGQVRVSILLSQTQPKLTKISFRSKPSPPGGGAEDFDDVNIMAQQFGGGGHIHAAGARLAFDIDEAKARVKAALGPVAVK
jgi:bifunctional oligoribonuclease and PAP phosphatase NrnA